MKNHVASILIGAGAILAATLLNVPGAHAEQAKDADKLVHKALKNRTRLPPSPKRPMRSLWDRPLSTPCTQVVSPGRKSW